MSKYIKIVSVVDKRMGLYDNDVSGVCTSIISVGSARQ
jgi:hypothetical protein